MSKRRSLSNELMVAKFKADTAEKRIFDLQTALRMIESKSWEPECDPSTVAELALKDDEDLSKKFGRELLEKQQALRHEKGLKHDLVSDLLLNEEECVNACKCADGACTQCRLSNTVVLLCKKWLNESTLVWDQSAKIHLFRLDGEHWGHLVRGDGLWVVKVGGSPTCIARDHEEAVLLLEKAATDLGLKVHHA